MKVNVMEMIDAMDENDLYKMQQDLSKGGIFLKKLIDKKIRNYETAKTGFCITCGEDLTKKQSSYTLIFGSEDFKKKACFCEVDCMEYFLSSLKKMPTAKVFENSEQVKERGEENAI